MGHFDKYYERGDKNSFDFLCEACPKWFKNESLLKMN
jgi:hypothetical protein